MKAAVAGIKGAIDEKIDKNIEEGNDSKQISKACEKRSQRLVLHDSIIPELRGKCNEVTHSRRLQ